MGECPWVAWGGPGSLGGGAARRGSPPSVASRKSQGGSPFDRIGRALGDGVRNPLFSLPPSLGSGLPREVAAERGGTGVVRAAPAELCLESGGIWAEGLVSQCELPLGPTCSAIVCFSLHPHKLSVCVFYVDCCGDFLPSSEHCHYCDFK